MAGAPGANAARAFEFHDDWSLALRATRYQLEEVKRTSIERAYVRMVATRGGKVSVAALYRLRSARQRIAVQIPGVDPQDTSATLDAQPLRIDNRVAPLEQDGTQFFIPLTRHAADQPVLVELRYTIEGSPASLRPPEFPDDPAVQQVSLGVWLPDEWLLLGKRGPWTDETTGRTFWLHDGELSEAAAAAPPDDRALLEQVRRGIASCETAGDAFPVDGRRYLFSTLRPPEGAAGALHLTTAHRNVVNAGVFLLVAIAGIVLTPRSVGARLWWLAALVVAIVLVAVFLPTLARALLGWPLALAMLLVLLIWSVRCLAWLVPGCLEWCAALFRRATTAVVVPTPALGEEGGAAHG
jgi:hypothetical protein